MAGVRLSKITIFLGALIAWHMGTSMAVLFNTLNETIIVTALTNAGDALSNQTVLHAGKDTITVTWAPMAKLLASDIANYKFIKVSLCYAPVSQVDRKWRKSNNDLKKDKTCQFKIVKQPYTGAGNHTYLIDDAVPSAFYFVRAYVLDASDTQVAYGQTTNKNKNDRIFEIVGISGRTLGVEISAGVFSAFSFAALVYFYVTENKKRK